MPGALDPPEVPPLFQGEFKSQAPVDPDHYSGIFLDWMRREGEAGSPHLPQSCNPDQGLSNNLGKCSTNMGALWSLWYTHRMCWDWFWKPWKKRLQQSRFQLRPSQKNLLEHVFRKTVLLSGNWSIFSFWKMIIL